jgi:predicted GH43/DUF377 family glycosyl hydrolase
LFSIAYLNAVCFAYEIVRVTVAEKNVTYLIHHGVARQIVNPETVVSLGRDPNTLPFLSRDILTEFKLGSTMPLIRRENWTPDEILRVNMQIAKELQPDPVPYELTYLGSYINPSVVLFKGRLLLGVALEWWYTDGQAANDHVEFRWYNHTKWPFFAHEPQMGIATEKVGDVHNSTVIYGQDPRVLVLDDNRLVVAYTSRMQEGWSIRMGIAMLQYNESSHKVEITRNYPIIHPDYDSAYHHKNWSPFMYNNETYLIQRLNPLHVVRVAMPNDTDARQTVQAVTVSIAPEVHMNWIYGELRGGTNAIFIGSRYLAFYHTSLTFKGNGYKTYLLGAYTFTAHPPFRLLEINRTPLLFDERMYTGEWDPIKNRRIDYCLFPMSFFLANETIYMTFGRNDQNAYIATMKLSDVLRSLDTL